MYVFLVASTWKEQKNHEVCHFPTDWFGIELGAFFLNQDDFLWCCLRFSVRTLLRAHPLTLAFIKYLLNACSVLGARAQWEADTQDGNLTLLATSQSMSS